MPMNSGIKVLLAITSVSAACAAFAGPTPQSFMPENDLWKQDTVESTTTINEEVFNQIIDLGIEYFQPEAEKFGEQIFVDRNWTDSTVNAYIRRDLQSKAINISMFGGLARRREITTEGLALVLCHELGHAYGGEPFKRPELKIAAEGQADFYGAGTCLGRILEKIPSSIEISTVTGYAAEKCMQVHEGDTNGYEHCIRALGAGMSVSQLLAMLERSEKEIRFETPDPTIAEETMLSYPKTVQCRLDTYHNAILGTERPACWFKSETH